MQILLNLAGFGPLSTSVAISANGMVGRRGRARMARRVWLAGKACFGWQAGCGEAREAGEARHGWQAGRGRPG